MPMLLPNSFSDYLVNPEIAESVKKNLIDFCLPATEKGKNHGVGSVSRIFNNLKMTYPKHEELAAIYGDMLSQGQGQENGDWIALLVATGYRDLFDEDGKLKTEIKNLLNQKLAPKQEERVIDSLYAIHGEEVVNSNILSSYIVNAYEVLFKKNIEAFKRDQETTTFISQQMNAFVTHANVVVNKSQVSAAYDVLVAVASKVDNQSLKIAIYAFNNERLRELDRSKATEEQESKQPNKPATNQQTVETRNGSLEVQLNKEIEKNKETQKTIANNTEQLEKLNNANLKLQGELNEVKKVRDRALYKKVNTKLQIIKTELDTFEQEILTELGKSPEIDLNLISMVATSLVRGGTEHPRELSSVTEKALRQYYSIEKLQNALREGNDPIEHCRSLIKEYYTPVDGKSHQSILEMRRDHPIVTAIKVLLTILSVGLAYAAGIFDTSGEKVTAKMKFFNSANIDKQEESIKEIKDGPNRS